MLRTNPLISRDAVADVHEDLFRWCLSRCGYERETAEDLMQQTYEEIVSGRARFAGESSLKTFLFGVAQNLAFSHFRKAAAHARLAERAAAATAQVIDDQRDAGESDGLDSRRVWQAVRALSDRQRDVIELVFCNEMTVEEAANVMRVSVGTARQHYSRAKASLAEQLADLRQDLAGSAMYYGAGNE